MEEAELGQAAGRAAVQPEAPEWLRQSQLDWFPEELIDKYGGTLYRTRLDGDALDLPADNGTCGRWDTVEPTELDVA